MKPSLELETLIESELAYYEELGGNSLISRTRRDMLRVIKDRLARGSWPLSGEDRRRYRVIHLAHQECGEPGYEARTELNVLHSEATLVLNQGRLEGGTAQTVGFCRRHGKPVGIIALDRQLPWEARAAALEFLAAHKPRTLNVAGPRESKRPGIYAQSLELLKRVFSKKNGSD